jgi:hypothetical protein
MITVPYTCISKYKVKFSLCLANYHTMKTYWGSEGIAPSILNLNTRWRWVVSFTPRPLYLRGKSTRYPLVRRLGGSQSRSGRGGEEEKSNNCPCRELNPNRPTRSLVSIQTELPRLQPDCIYQELNGNSVLQCIISGTICMKSCLRFNIYCPTYLCRLWITKLCYAEPEGNDHKCFQFQAWNWEPVWTRWRWQIAAIAGNRTPEPRSSSPLASRYTDWATPALFSSGPTWKRRVNCTVVRYCVGHLRVHQTHRTRRTWYTAAMYGSYVICCIETRACCIQGWLYRVAKCSGTMNRAGQIVNSSFRACCKTWLRWNSLYAVKYTCW